MRNFRRNSKIRIELVVKVREWICSKIDSCLSEGEAKIWNYSFTVRASTVQSKFSLMSNLNTCIKSNLVANPMMNYDVVFLSNFVITDHF